MSVNNLLHRKQSGPVQKYPLSVNVYSPTETKGDNAICQNIVYACVYSLLEICVHTPLRRSMLWVLFGGPSLPYKFKVDCTISPFGFLQANNNTTLEREGKCTTTKQYMYMHFLAIPVAAYSEAKSKLNTGRHGMVQYSHTLVFIVAVQFGNRRLFRHVFQSHCYL